MRFVKPGARCLFRAIMKRTSFDESSEMLAEITRAHKCIPGLFYDGIPH